MSPQETKDAIDRKLPVLYEGKVYPRINAYIYRMIRDPYNGKEHTILQIEIQDKVNNSVFIADPRKVSVVQKEKPPANGNSQSG